MTSSAVHASSSVSYHARETNEDVPALAPSAEDLAAADDPVLVRWFQQGARDAFEELYRRHEESVREVCRGRLPRPDLVDDAVQEIFTRALEGLKVFDGRMDVEHWLRKVAKNHCVDLLRTLNREAAPVMHGEARPVDPPDPTAECAFDQIADRSATVRVLKPLSDRDRGLLLTHHAHDVSLETLASRMDMTRGAVAVAVHRARTRARRIDGSGLFGLSPVLGWWRERRHAFERLLVGAEQLGGFGIAHTAALAVAVVLSVPLASADVAHAEPGQGLVGPVPTADAVQNRDASPPEEALPPAGKGPGSAAEPAPSDHPPPAPADPPVPIDRVDVPVTGTAVHQEERDPDLSYGARVDAGEESTDLRIESYDNEEVAPAEDAVCQAAQAGDPVTYCER